MSNPMEATLKIRADLERELQNHRNERREYLEKVGHEKTTRRRLDTNRAGLITQGHSDKTIQSMFRQSESRSRTLVDRIEKCDKFISTGEIELEGLDRRIEKMSKTEPAVKAKPVSNLSLTEMRQWQERHDARPTNRQDQTVNTRP